MSSKYENPVGLLLHQLRAGVLSLRLADAPDAAIRENFPEEAQSFLARSGGRIRAEGHPTGDLS